MSSQVCIPSSRVPKSQEPWTEYARPAPLAVLKEAEFEGRPGKLVIVGGVAGGASAAARARRLSENTHILIIEKGAYVSYANCLLPYSIGGEIKKDEDLIVVTPQKMKDWYNLDVRVQSEAVQIDRKGKKIKIKTVQGDEYWESYDKLVLSPGASPFKPVIPGINLPNIFSLRTINDLEFIKARAEKINSVTVIGAGFIGCELVENLIKIHKTVTLIEMSDQVMPPFDKEMTIPLCEMLLSNNVDVKLNTQVTEFTSNGNGTITMHTKENQKLETEMVLLAIGVKPDSDLAKDCGLELGIKSSIKVNEFMQTSDPHIYAVGDAIEVVDVIPKEPVHVPLAGPANRQGRIAADHMFGRLISYRGTQGSSIIRVFDLVLAMTGESEKNLKKYGIEYEKLYLHPYQHVSHYPNAKSMCMKILFAKKCGRILGGQVIGVDGIDKKVDIIATAIQAGMTVFDLEELELCYAPPFNSAKDALNMAGFVGAGMMRNDHINAYMDSNETIIISKFPDISTGNDKISIPIKQNKEFAIIDVRTEGEYKKGHIYGAINMPIHTLRDQCNKEYLDGQRKKPVIVYCRSGFRGYLAACILREKEIDARNLSGGYLTYLQYNPAELRPRLQDFFS